VLLDGAGAPYSVICGECGDFPGGCDFSGLRRFGCGPVAHGGVPAGGGAFSGGSGGPGRAAAGGGASPVVPVGLAPPGSAVGVARRRGGDFSPSLRRAAGFPPSLRRPSGDSLPSLRRAAGRRSPSGRSCLRGSRRFRDRRTTVARRRGGSACHRHAGLRGPADAPGWASRRCGGKKPARTSAASRPATVTVRTLRRRGDQPQRCGPAVAELTSAHADQPEGTGNVPRDLFKPSLRGGAIACR
jgi:hypothetical protein